MRLRLLAPLALLLAVPARGAAQAGSCELVESRQANAQQFGGFTVASISGPLRVVCQGGATLRADSAVIYQATNEVQLFRNVDYQDPTRRLTSQNATYNSTTGRLYATVDVTFTDLTRGSTLHGPELEYYREMPGRPQAQVIATQRPHLTVVPKNNDANAGSGNAANRQEPLQIDGDRVTTLGENYFAASGNVVIHRSDLDATATEATHDSQQETLQLRGNATIRGERFDLAGETVDATLPGGRIDHVVARQNAQLVSEKLRVDGPEIQLFFKDDLLQRLITFAARLAGPPPQTAGAPAPGAAGAAGRGNEQPVVSANGFVLQADSLEALLPGQRLDRVTAYRNARGETFDTVGRTPAATGPRARLARIERPASAGLVQDRDWVTGDTITGYFVPADTTARPAGARPPRPRTQGQSSSPEDDVELKRVVARGSAHSFYRVREKEDPNAGAAQKGRADRPGLNYLVGDQIELLLKNRELDVAHVEGLKRGVYLDPANPDSAADSTRARTRAGAAGNAPARTPGTTRASTPGSGTPADRRKAAPPPPQARPSSQATGKP
ncbi:MAG: hypothetical protein JO040_10215 [Gemmatimonadetes bacterium]|nr:hypothetical protein [Gemmatimonadota bacterium]